MKKLSLAAILAAGAITLAACGASEASSSETPETGLAEGGTIAIDRGPLEIGEPGQVTVVDFNGDVVTVQQNPTTVAIYDFGILDMLYSVGFENTGIETLILPQVDSLPEVLSYFRDTDDVTVISGGSLFYIDWDVLDLVVPETVIFGGRAFGMNAAGDRLPADEAQEFRAATEARYTETSFLRLGVNNQVASTLEDMERNVNVLSAIFPGIADALEAEMEEIRQGMAAINEVVSESGYTAIFAMMLTSDRMSLFMPNSRFGMIYNEFGFAAAGEELPEWTDQHGFEARTEFILELNPDVIFLLDRSEYGDSLAADSYGPAVQAFINDPIIGLTNAYENDHIYYNLGPAEWYTITGGFTSARRMISDVNQFVESLEQ